MAKHSKKTTENQCILEEYELWITATSWQKDVKYDTSKYRLMSLTLYWHMYDTWFVPIFITICVTTIFCLPFSMVLWRTKSQYKNITKCATKTCHENVHHKMFLTNVLYIYKIMSCSTRNHWWDLMSYVHNTKSSKPSCIQLENLNNKTWIALPLTMSHKMWFVVIANVCCLLSIYTSIAWSWYIMSNSTFVHSAALQHEAVLGLVRWSYALRNALWVQYSSSMYWTGPFQHIKSPIEACALGGRRCMLS